MFSHKIQVERFGGYQISVPGNVVISGLDFKLPTNTRGETKIWLMGMQSYMLRGTKIVGATKYAQAGILPFKFPTQ